MKVNERRKSISSYTRFIAHEEQSSYMVEIPFNMPDHVEEIHIAYQVESHGEPIAVIDLGIRDSHRTLGWSGGARTEFWMSKERATPGYLAIDLTPGAWAVLHNAYKVPEEGCTVTVVVEFYYKTPRWLKGDLHTHSVNSDGTFTLEENAAIMEQLGCDFIAMTDHNTTSQNFTYPRNTNVVMIPGMEFTSNYGHSNFLGVADPLNDFRVSSFEEVKEKFGKARERGAKIVLNHPHCDFCPWEWDFNIDHDWVEVWNGPFTARNIRTLNWWQNQLESGRRLVAVGGSDTHRPDPYVKHAMPCTWVYAEEKTVTGILHAISQGRVFLTYAPDGPFIELICDSYIMGEIVPKSNVRDRRIKLLAEDLIAGDLIKLISERGTEKEVTISEDGSVKIEADTTGRLFYRAEVWRHFKQVGLTMMAAMTNPIYLER
jgi:hypothetical protein